MRRLLVFTVLLLAASVFLNAQGEVIEVEQSSGFVEALLANLGWRAAVVGRQLPPASVLTSWVGATAKLSYADSIITVGQLTHLTVLELGTGLVRISLEAGDIRVDTSTVTYELQFRDFAVRIEKGAVILSDGILTVESGSVQLNAAQNGPMRVVPGSPMDLLSSAQGPVFLQDEH